MTDFVTALAQRAAAGAAGSLLCKAERIAKRQDKRKRKQDEQQQHQQKQQKKRKEETKQSAVPSRRSKNQERLLEQWKAHLAALVEAHAEKPRYAKILETSDRKPRNYPHSVHHKKMKSSLEPRKSDYGGLGLARPTLYLPFSDPSWIPRLEQAFAEHVPGWSGKPPMMQAMKKQRDSNLLWRRLQREKASGKGRGMTADERVEAMLQSGDLI